MIPTIIVDNFFSDPDKIVDFAMSQQFYDTNGKWPGKRTEFLHYLNPNLFNFICKKILTIISLENSKYWEFDIQFQLIKPFDENQFNLKNCGWVHSDFSSGVFSGIIYLNKIPEKNTGTSIYLPKLGYWDNADLNSKIKNFLGEEVPDSKFKEDFDISNSQFEESIIVNNVYNRLVMFSGNTHHAAQTYGKDQERLTLVFFCKNITINKSSTYS